MKYPIITLFFFQSVTIIAQTIDAKRDYIWLTGRDNSPRINTLQWNFNFNPTHIDTIHRKQGNWGQVGMISDTKGNLLLFSNGCHILDKNDSIIPSTQSLNQGTIHQDYCPPNGSGYPAAPMLILPMPNDTNSFVIFHTHVVLSNDNPADGLWITQLAKNSTSAFQISFINKVLINDIMERGHLTACRHANGRDWWILHPKVASNSYHKVLFTPNGFQKRTQIIGIPSTHWENTGGQAVFSPDGTKYVRYNVQSDVRIFDFDRCTGELSNPIHIPIEDAADTIGFAGCAISPNSRYLYIISTNHVYQFDLQSNNIAASKKTVLIYDNYQEVPNYYIRFSQAQLGNDGKIYITSNFRGFVHTIEQPDSLVCKAIQRTIKTPFAIYDILPYFPNFRLGALKNSPCDTLKNVKYENYDLNVSPNPVIDNLIIDITLPNYENINIEIEIFDMAGRRAYVTKLPPFTSIHNVNVSAFANGMYLVCLKENGYPVITQKLMILH